MTSNEARAILLDIIEELFSASTDTALQDLISKPDFDLASLTDSSLSLTEMVMRLEEETGVMLENADVLAHPTCTAFCQMLAERTTAS